MQDADWQSGSAMVDTMFSTPGTSGRTPGTRPCWNRAASENRVLITVDKDFGELIHLHGTPPRRRLNETGASAKTPPERNGHQTC